jgi:hypothetical protein
MATLPSVPACIAQWNLPANKARLAISRLHPTKATVQTSGTVTSVTWGRGKPTQTKTVVCVLVFFLPDKTVFAMGHLAPGVLGPARVTDWSWVERHAAPPIVKQRAVARDGRVR